MDETKEYLKAATEAALEAGDMLLRNLERAGEVHFKGVVDLVTDCDNRSERMIFERISSRFPDHDFLAEESLFKESGSVFRWIIDPLDGTTNYAHKFPVFCVSIALEREGELLVGVVHDPARREMFHAARGQGAFLNERRIRVSSVGDLNLSLLATGFPYDVRESRVNNMSHFKNFLVRAQAVRRCGSAAMDLCYVACGRFDGFWELKLQPWDMAAGALILREAGGRVTDFSGGEFSLFNPEILGTNGFIHDQMMEILKIGLMEESRIARKEKRNDEHD